MAAQQQQLITLIFLDFLPSLLTDPSTAPSVWTNDIAPRTKAIPGVLSLYLGRIVEKPDRWVAAAIWSSPDALVAFASSADYQPWFSAIANAAATHDQLLLIQFPAAAKGNAAAALGAPVTEILTLQGVEDDYVEGGLASFFEALDAGKLAGHHGSTFGGANFPDESAVEVSGPGAVGLLGWDSVEVHKSHRGEGKLIDNNISLLRNGAKGLKMVHAAFTKQ